MDTRHARRAFTIIELLTVITIIAVLAAILFPVFGAVREQARQSSTLSNLHNIYVGARLYDEDEGAYPTSLFGYAEVPDANYNPTYPYRPALSTDNPANVVPMDQFVTFQKSGASGEPPLAGYLYREQVKDLATFLCPDNAVTDKRAMTEVYYPPAVARLLNQPTDPTGFVPVRWQAPSSSDPTVSGDPDLPDNNYAGQPKMYYKADSMDIGPMLTSNGTVVKDQSGNIIYELHYTPDWTHKLGAVADIDPDNGNKPIVTQMKYKNPPTESTVITYVTDHAAYAGSGYVMVLTLSGTVRKRHVGDVIWNGQGTLTGMLPLNYQP